MKVLCTKWIPEDLKNAYPNFEFIYPEKVDTAFTTEELFENVKDVDAIFTVSGTPIRKDLIDAAKNLKAIASMGVGYDHVDVAYCTEKKIPVCNSPTKVTDPTAEHTIALIVGIFHNLASYTNDVKKGIWENHPFGMKMTSVNGKTLGLIGFGRIGQCVARKAKALGMNIIYYDLNKLDESKEKELEATYMDLDSLMKTADCVSLHIPFVQENYHMINDEKINLMKDGSYLINAARGAVVDIDAVVKALKSGKLKGAAIDCFEPEPYKGGEICTLDNVIFTPHVASETPSGRVNMSKEALDGIIAVLNGEVPANLINKDSIK